MSKDYQMQRRLTREVLVGKVGVGGKNPVRIQSMTTSDTRDPLSTADQIMKLADRGCELARVTVQGKKEADACEQIKEILVKKGYDIPLVADIHFYPPAAMRVVDFCDKVRINPGNFVDKRAQFKVVEYDEATYQAELERIEEKFSPLVEKCKRLKRAMRIGTNHGSLSDRIMNRYGDTPLGMVESALEFARVARALDYHELIFSMKASHTQVMIEAYRLLVKKMDALGWDYPLHLGVTEAGEGEDGRIKSAIGIGALLLDGLGDTVRVSLTEDPWNEIAPCQKLKTFSEDYQCTLSIPYPLPEKRREKALAPFLHREGSVALTLSLEEVESDSFFQDIGCTLSFGEPQKEAGSVDIVVAPFDHPKLEKLEAIGIKHLKQAYSFSSVEELDALLEKAPEALFFAPLKERAHVTRALYQALVEKQVTLPLFLQFRYGSEEVEIESGCEMGSALCDRLAEGICLEASLPLAERRFLSFSLLQGARMRSSKTEYISCPGCGRTLFDLQSVAAGIREKTDHLVGVKIAIMGCIVNGPGEMADADFGYVGSRPGMIDLYVGKECVEKNIPMERATDQLIELIKARGMWMEPNTSCTT